MLNAAFEVQAPAPVSVCLCFLVFLFQPIHSVFMSLLSLVQRLSLSLCFSRCPMFGISTGIWP